LVADGLWRREIARRLGINPRTVARMLASIALGLKACQRGYRVAFATAQEGVSRLEAAQDRNSLRAKLRRLERYHLRSSTKSAAAARAVSCVLEPNRPFSMSASEATLPPPSNSYDLAVGCPTMTP
jgi:uncharacterized protein (DUF58 family)